MTKRAVNSKIAVIFLAASSILLLSTFAFGCRRVGTISFDEIFAADVIVRATAEKYVGNPDLSIKSFGETDVQIEFKVDEVLKGSNLPDKLVLNGYLSSDDDFNEQEVPYHFVRRGGRGGSCFANTYKSGGSFLLFLKKTKEGYTPNISALGPTNEQLHGPNDPWLAWSRNEIVRRGKAHP